MYGEPFYIPKPDDLIFTTWYADGNIFRGGATFTRGFGKIFYFQPGHETFPTYYNKNVQTVIKNAAQWAAFLAKGRLLALLLLALALLVSNATRSFAS